MLAGPEGDGWCAAARAAAERCGVPSRRTGSVRTSSTPRAASPASTASARPGAALVRPDGFVAWRAREAGTTPNRALGAAIAYAVSRPERSRAIEARRSDVVSAIDDIKIYVFHSHHYLDVPETTSATGTR